MIRAPLLVFGILQFLGVPKVTSDNAQVHATNIVDAQKKISLGILYIVYSGLQDTDGINEV